MAVRGWKPRIEHGRNLSASRTHFNQQKVDEILTDALKPKEVI